MTEEQKNLQEQAKKIEEIYNEAIRKLGELAEERNDKIHDYIKELETQKIEAIRTSILSKEQ